MCRVWIIAALLLSVVGCGGDPSFVGEWTNQTNTAGITSTTQTENRADGTFVSITKTAGNSTSATLISTDSGTWKLDGDRLTISIKDIDWKFEGGNPEAVKRAKERLENNKAAVIAEANRDLIGTIKWNGKDEFTFTAGDGKPYIYRRK